MRLTRTTHIAAFAALLAAAAVATAEPGNDEPFPPARQKELAEQAGFRIVPGPDAAKDDQPPPADEACGTTICRSTPTAGRACNLLHAGPRASRAFRVQPSCTPYN